MSENPKVRLKKTASKSQNALTLASYDVYVNGTKVGSLWGKKGRWRGAKYRHVFTGVSGQKEYRVAVHGAFRENLDRAAVSEYKAMSGAQEAAQ